MIRFSHCKSEVIRYVGENPLEAGSPMRSSEWQFQDGSYPAYGSIRRIICPDCNQVVELNRLDVMPSLRLTGP